MGTSFQGSSIQVLWAVFFFILYLDVWSTVSPRQSLLNYVCFKRNSWAKTNHKETNQSVVTWICKFQNHNFSTCDTWSFGQFSEFFWLNLWGETSYWSFLELINNGTWNEGSGICSEIICMISKLNKRTAQVQIEITSMTSDQNCFPLRWINTLLDSFWNHTI